LNRAARFALTNFAALNVRTSLVWIMIRAAISLYDWLTFRDYEAAKEGATNRVVERLSRGNTLAQDGSAMEQDDLDRLSAAADVALRKMSAITPS
jgi:hypothetical protein